MRYYQQGDVILKKIESLPKGLKKLPTKVLQLGEVTGHKHQFDASDNVDVYINPDDIISHTSITPDENKFIIVGNTAYLRHEEHKTIAIEPGTYQIDIVREFDYEEMEAKRVVD